MKIKCEICDSSLYKDGEHLVCEGCGVKYTPDYVRNLIKSKNEPKELSIEKEEVIIEEVPVIDETPVTETSEYIKCGSCGGLNHNDAIYCGHCGFKLNGAVEPVVEESTEEVEEIIPVVEVIEEVAAEVEESAVEGVIEESIVEEVVEPVEEIIEEIIKTEVVEIKEVKQEEVVECHVEENTEKCQYKAKMKKFLNLFKKSEKPKGGEKAFHILSLYFYITTLVFIGLVMIAYLGRTYLMLENYFFLIGQHFTFFYFMQIISSLRYVLLFIGSFALSIVYICSSTMKRKPFMAKFVFVIQAISLCCVFSGYFRGFNYKYISFHNYGVIYDVIRFLCAVLLVRQLFFTYAYIKRSSGYKFITGERKNLWDKLLLTSLFILFLSNTVRILMDNLVTFWRNGSVGMLMDYSISDLIDMIVHGFHIIVFGVILFILNFRFKKKTSLLFYSLLAFEGFGILVPVIQGIFNMNSSSNSLIVYCGYTDVICSIVSFIFLSASVAFLIIGKVTNSKKTQVIDK